jgi:prepilin-type N-terminal cleavage/methylation domain-containing protein/prepilin-type processing-associated H-X9-DG protein
MPTQSASTVSARNIRAFTLIELLVVISIIAILASMLLPVIGTIRDTARQTKCSGLQRQFQLANVAYANENDGLVVPQVRIIPATSSFQSWARNTAYAELMEALPIPGSTERNYTAKMLCPVVDATLYKNGQAQVQNFDKGPWVYNLSLSQPATRKPLIGAGVFEIYTYPLGKITKPAESVAFAEGEGWNVGYFGTYNPDGTFNLAWAPRIVEQGVGVPGASDNTYSARHRDRMNVVFWDGHTGSFKRLELNADNDINAKVDPTPENRQRFARR